jgi:hypothetical protein
LAVGVLAPGPEDILPALLLRDRQAVVRASGDENKWVFGIRKVNGLGLLVNFAAAFGVGYLPHRETNESAKSAAKRSTQSHRELLELIAAPAP